MTGSALLPLCGMRHFALMRPTYVHVFVDILTGFGLTLGELIQRHLQRWLDRRQAAVTPALAAPAPTLSSAQPQTGRHERCWGRQRGWAAWRSLGYQKPICDRRKNEASSRLPTLGGMSYLDPIAPNSSLVAAPPQRQDEAPHSPSTASAGMITMRAVAKFALPYLARWAIDWLFPDWMPDIVKKLITDGVLALPDIWRYCAAKLRAAKAVKAAPSLPPASSPPDT